MARIQIDQPHGVFLDAEGRVVLRFGNWETGEKEVPDAVESVEYVDGPAAHERRVDPLYQPDEPGGG